MYQSFEAATRPSDGPPRLAALRELLAAADFNGCLIPRADAHQGEYVAPRDEVLAWLTGFTGSAGFAVITQRHAGVFVDGRYRVQIKAEVDLDHYTPVSWPETKLSDWLKEHLPDGGRVGFDPWLHSRAEIARNRSALEGCGVELAPLPSDFIETIWSDRPKPPDAEVLLYPSELAGETEGEKRKRVGATLAEAGQDHALLTLPDSIAWLLNIRGRDISRIPIAQGFVILDADGTARLYRRSGNDPALAKLLGTGVELRAEAAFLSDVHSLTGKVRADPKSAPVAVTEALETSRATPCWEDDPCLLPKARKNTAELAGTTEAHLRDGAAMAEFLSWLDRTAPNGGLTEIDVVERLEDCRRNTGALLDISFDTICGSGPNGAIVHYRVSRKTNRTIVPGDLVLVDSGGQYLDGTTDVTRAITTGSPTPEQRSAFTRVLQGMIAISRARWPVGLRGRDLDPLARAPLWMAGQDFDHGTGHGVGVYLSVHEGPQRISRLSDVALEPGMILSNEPGYYREGAWGIRIENLVVVEKAPAIPGGDDGRDQLAFRTLTWVPIDTRLVEAQRLSPGERDWLNAYHAGVRERIAPRVSPKTGDWLRAVTAVI